MGFARFQVLLSAVLFGTTGTAQALGPDDLDPLAVGALRVLVGGAILAAIAAVAGGLFRPWPPARVAIAGAGVALYQVAFFEAVARTGVGVGAVVAIGSGPVLAGLLERATGGAWPGRRWLAATMLATAGVTVLTLAAVDDATLSPLGIALALLSGLGYATYTVVAKTLLRDGGSPLGVMGASFGLGALLLIPVAAVRDLSWLDSGGGVALVVYLGLLPTALAYVLFARGLRRLTAAEVTTLVLAEPLVALALGAVVLDERIGGTGAVGAACVLAGLAVLAGLGGRRGRLPWAARRDSG